MYLLKLWTNHRLKKFKIVRHFDDDDFAHTFFEKTADLTCAHNIWECDVTTENIMAVKKDEIFSRAEF